jgi:ABC-type multidrug transport system fused ATPase/permease subunit
LQNITSQNKTSLIIAHRLSTIRNVDEIIVFHQGKIVERGGFDELMRRKEYFFKLAEGTGFGVC